MPNYIPSLNMALPVPKVGIDPGPDYATDLNTSLTILDAHTHAPGSGVQITPSGLNMTADLPFNNSNNITMLRSLRFYPNGSPLAAASDLGCLYEAGVDLYYNDGAGNQIRITQGGNVSGSAGTITGLPSGTASASFASASGTFVFQQATATAANMDVATLIIRYPGSYPTPSGNYIALQAPTSLATGYAITLPANLPGANNTFLTLNTSGIMGNVVVDNLTLEVTGPGALQVKNLGITTAKLADNSVTSAKIVDGTITGNDIAAGTIIATNIAAATITGGNIAAATVTGGVSGNIAASTLTAFNMGNNINFPGKAVQESGANVVVSNANATNSLSIIRGGVNSSGTPTLGEGFTAARTGTGAYTLTFSTAFGDSPCVTANAFGTGRLFSVLNSVGTTSITVAIYSDLGTATDSDFMFHAIGQRA